MKLFLSILYIFLPATIHLILAKYYGITSYFSDLHVYLSEIGICVVIIYRSIKKTCSKSMWLLFAAFAALLFADVIYTFTINEQYREWIPIVYLGETGYTIFVTTLLIYLVFKLRPILKDYISISLALIVAVTFAYLSFTYILIPYYHVEPTPPLFHLINSTIYTLIQAVILGLIIPSIFRGNNQNEHIFLQSLLLLCIADFALRYHSGIESDTPLTWYSHVWDITIATFFITLLNGEFIFNKVDYVKSYVSVRTFLTIAISTGILFFLGLLYAIGLLNVGDAFQLTNLMLIVFLIWFISNFISLKISNQILMITAMLFRPDEQFDVEDVINSGHLKIRKVESMSRISEIDDILYHYNELVYKANILLDVLAEKNKLAAIGQTTSMLAHDVRKPFSIIKAMMESYDTYINDPGALKEAKQSLDQSIRHVESMLNDIMDFSREVKLDVKPTPIMPVIDFAIRQVAQYYKDADIDFVYEISHVNRPLVDDERIARVFINILSNAIEAILHIGKSKHGTIDISTQDMNRAGNNMVAMVIGNDGPRLNKDDIPKLFDSFFTKGKRKGTGIGLASAHKIIALHIGTITARNKDNGRGVEFIIIIPASNILDKSDCKLLPRNIKETQFKDLTKNETEIENMITELLKKGEMIKVLLLDDEALYRASVRNTIKQNGSLDRAITLYEAHNVEEALSLLVKENILHAIVDIDLGEVKNGFDFLEIVQRQYPNLRCMVHSNRCIEEDKNKAMKLGVVSFVPKSLNIAHLVEFLNVSSIDEVQNKHLENDSVTLNSPVTSNQNPTKVLLVNDDPSLHIMMKSMLSKAFGMKNSSDKHLEFSVAGTYSDAVILMKNHSFDYIFSDLDLGEDKNGMDIIKVSRELNQPSKIYIVSGTQRCDAEPEALKLGADGYFQLPVTVNDFITIF
ncbi:MAG: response regulator [Pseudomonadota bacterium]